jgi:hypothetical protein
MKVGLSSFSILGISALAFSMYGYAAAQTTTQNIQLVGAQAKLISAVDSKDAAQGQVITAELTDNVKAADSTDLRKGTLLVGKVEEVQKSDNNGPAKLTVVFDQAKLKDGKTIPIKATILGAFPAPEGFDDDNYSPVALLPQSIPDTRQVDQEPGTLSHVSMHSAVQSDASGVFTSDDRNINLQRGTQLQFALAPEAATSAQPGN